MNRLKETAKALRQKFKAYTSSLLEQLYALPNLTHESVPIGNHADHNLIIYQTPLSSKRGNWAHWDLMKKYDLVDFELGNKITGAVFPVYKGKGAKLQRALSTFF